MSTSSPTHAPHADVRPDGSSIGILLGFASFAAFSVSDASVKLIAGALPPYESAFFGALFGLVVLPSLRRPGDRWSDVLRTTDRRLWLLRFFAYAVGVVGSVTAFTHLSMAEAFTLIFLQPIWVIIVSIFALREPVGPRSWGAVALGFLGVLVVLRPGFRELSIGHLGAVFAGLGGAVSMVTFRAAGREKRLPLVGAGILGGVVVCGLLTIPDFVMPTARQGGLLAAYGLLAAAGNLLLMQAASRVPATWIGPTQYSQMLWAIGLGYVLFGDAVDLPTALGIALIVGSGALTLRRDGRRRRSEPGRSKS